MELHPRLSELGAKKQNYRRVVNPYEQYRERLAKDDDNIDSVRRAEESGCILVEDRAFLERV